MSSGERFRYTVSIRGEGGEFYYVPMSEETVAFWKTQGIEALRRHPFSGSYDESLVPADRVVGSYFDVGDGTFGVDLDADHRITVEDQDGAVCFELADAYLHSDTCFKRDIAAPPSGAFYRSHEKGTEVYEIVTSEPFDAAKLKLIGVRTPNADLINVVQYDGKDAEQVGHIDRSWAEDEVEFVGSPETNAVAQIG